MVKTKISKTEALQQIEEFFQKINDKETKDVKKIKKLAMTHNIKLGERRKLFCKKCLMPHKDSSIQIKNDRIKITCGNCEHKNRWKVK